MKIHYEQTRHTDENFTKDKEHSWLAIFFCKNHPSCPRSSSRVSNRMTRNGSWAPTDVLISFWLFTDTCCSLSLIKLGNNRWRNACSPPPPPRSSSGHLLSVTLPSPLLHPSALSLFLSLTSISLLSSPVCVLLVRLVVGWQGCVVLEAKAGTRWGRVPDKVTATNC